VTAVDHKPKRTTRLQRLENVRRNPLVTLLVDHYAEDWTALWWVRAGGHAEVVDHPEHDLIDALVAKYDQYREVPPAGPAIVITVTDLTGWAASG
jgi:PPOX class probable F420-dependent enzyme